MTLLTLVAMLVVTRVTHIISLALVVTLLTLVTPLVVTRVTLVTLPGKTKLVSQKCHKCHN